MEFSTLIIIHILSIIAVAYVIARKYIVVTDQNLELDSSIDKWVFILAILIALLVFSFTTLT